jgi:hypothetical protein
MTFKSKEWFHALSIAGILTASSTLVHPARARDASLAEIVSATSSYFSNLTRPNLKVSPPRFHIALQGEQIPGGCYSKPGDKTVYGSSYCPATNTIILEIVQLENIRRRYGAGGVAFIVAHEYAHFMQDYAGIRLKDPYHELHADCMGASLLLSGDGHAIRHLGIRKSDVVAMVQTAFAIGGGRVHGSSSQRLNAFMHGAQNSLIECDYYAGVRPRPSTVAIKPQTLGPQRGLSFTWASKYYVKGRLRGQADLRPAWPISLGQSQFGQAMRLKHYQVFAMSSTSSSGAEYSIDMHIDEQGRTLRADYSCLDRKYATHPNSVQFAHDLKRATPAPPEMVYAFQEICNELVKN